MKRRIVDRWFPANAMGQGGLSARRRYRLVIYLAVAAIVICSFFMFFGRYLKEKNKDPWTLMAVYRVTADGKRVLENYPVYYYTDYVFVNGIHYKIEEFVDGQPVTEPEWPKYYQVETEIVKVSNFDEMMGGVFWLLPVVIVFAIVEIIMNYCSFYRPTKSIYLMKRLRSGAELHRRCLTMPIIMILVSVLVCVGLGALYYWVYCNYTIPERLPDRITVNIGRMLLWWS